MQATQLLHTLSMLIITGFLLLACASTITSLLNLPALETNLAQQTCLNLCSLSDHESFLRAIVCGEPLRDPIARSHFERTSLIHILVVSGSHLVVLESLLQNFLSLRLRAVVLVLFSITTGLQPPILRALISLTLEKTSQDLRMNWARWQIITLAGFISLLFVRTHWSLISLSLSWSAALILEITSSGRKSFLRLAIQQFVIFSLLSVPLASISVPHPVAVISNMVLAPVFSLLLFPASLASLAVNHFLLVTDGIWDAALWLVAFAADLFPEQSAPVFEVSSNFFVLASIWLFTLTVLARLKAKHT